MTPGSELLLRNASAFPSSCLLIGAPEDGIVGKLGVSNAALTNDYGVWRRQGGEQGGWHWGYEALSGGWGTVIVFMPKARSELAMRLAFAADQAVPGGRIWLVGGKNEGIASGGKRFRALFADAAKIDSARHCQLWCATVDSAKERERFDLEAWFSRWVLDVAGVSVPVYGLPGVFSDGRLDPGTRLLLETLTERPAEPVLDFACGAGVIGVWMRQQWPDLELELCDAQWQAVACARRVTSGDPGAQVIPGDGLEAATGPYGMIVTNPPFHQGVKTDRGVTETFLRQVRRYLRPGGELRLVANAFLPYPRLMRETLGPVETLADNGQYRVYSVHRSN